MRAFLALLLIAMATPCTAQQLVTSSEAETVSLTVYRDGSRGERPINKNWPQGYALITETRTVTIPAGESVVRFEGVAEGMFPESAIVTGLPKGVKEKNRDARLLSPAGLVDAYLKREVTLTRTDKATGKVREQQALITAGPNGGVILQTAEGYEALRCTGLPERMRYGTAPKDLSAKPTLSVITQSDQAVTVKLTLTYMAGGFDWQANYIAQVREAPAPQPVATPGTAPVIGKEKVDLFAWLTLANGGNQSFLNANTMAIAGSPNRVARGQQPRPTGQALRLSCWPQQRTHQVPFYLPYNLPVPPPPPAPEPAGLYYLADAAEEVVVTAAKRRGSAKEVSMAPVAAIVAEQEDLGDLKLYRIPEPVTVNAKGQKQVAMIVKPGASFDRIYTANVNNFGEDGYSAPLAMQLKTKNKSDKGLGLPMPSGQVMVFQDSNYGPLVTGEATLKDRTTGDDIKLTIGASNDVRAARTRISESRKIQKYKMVISNARNEPVNVEIEIPYQLRGSDKQIAKVDGVPTWKAEVPANGEATFFYELKLGRE
jgi:hypothetical protein